MGIWNAFARAYRNTRALGAAIAMVVAVVVMSVVRCQEQGDPIVEQGSEVGTVVAATVVEGTNLVRGRIALATADTIEMMFSGPAPRASEGIPLKVIVRESGAREYTVDEEARLIGGWQ